MIPEEIWDRAYQTAGEKWRLGLPGFWRPFDRWLRRHIFLPIFRRYNDDLKIAVIAEIRAGLDGF